MQPRQCNSYGDAQLDMSQTILDVSNKVSPPLGYGSLGGLSLPRLLSCLGRLLLLLPYTKAPLSGVLFTESGLIPAYMTCSNLRALTTAPITQPSPYFVEIVAITSLILRI
jgi:hypothetical protein